MDTVKIKTIEHMDIEVVEEKPIADTEEALIQENITIIDDGIALVSEIEHMVILEDTDNLVIEQPEPEPAPEPTPLIKSVDQSEALMITDTPDENYTGSVVVLAPEDRDLLERLVMGEAGGEGYEGAALVAQAIRDTIVYKGFDSAASVRETMKYSGSIKKEPNENVKNAVAYIFDEGGIAVKHSIFYFYAPKYCAGKWHETQKFIIEHKGHRFFSEN